MEKKDNEILLSDEENRYVIFPIKHDDIWKMYKKAEPCCVGISI